MVVLPEEMAHPVGAIHFGLGIGFTPATLVLVSIDPSSGTLHNTATVAATIDSSEVPKPGAQILHAARELPRLCATLAMLLVVSGFRIPRCHC